MTGIGGGVGVAVGIACHLTFSFPASGPHDVPITPAKHLVLTEDQV